MSRYERNVRLTPNQGQVVHTPFTFLFCCDTPSRNYEDSLQLQVTIFMITNNIHLSVALNSMPDKEWCTSIQISE